MGLNYVGGKYYGIYENKLTITANFTSATYNTVGRHGLILANSGLIAMMLIPRIDAALTSGGAATLSLGIDFNPGFITAADGVANWGVNRIAGPTGAGTNPKFNYYLGSDSYNFCYVISSSGSYSHVGYEILVAALTGGTMVVDCFWTPITPGAYISDFGGAAMP